MTDPPDPRVSRRRRVYCSRRCYYHILPADERVKMMGISGLMDFSVSVETDRVVPVVGSW